MIRKDDILKMTEKGISVFRYYLPVDFKVGKNFLNPFYKDTKASCNIYYERKAGVFKMKDFGNEDYSGDCFELVGRLNGLSCKEPKEFVEIMEMINRDLHLGLSAHEEYHVSHSKVPQKSEVVSEEPKAKSVWHLLYSQIPAFGIDGESQAKLLSHYHRLGRRGLEGHIRGLCRHPYR